MRAPLEATPQAHGAKIPVADPEREKPMLFANYYAWYLNGERTRWAWEGWTRSEAKQNSLALAAQRDGQPPLSSAAYPLVGLYDSADPAIAQWRSRQLSFQR